MPIVVNRQELIQQLDAVSPGLATREIIEQSSCFVFKDKSIITYNDEVSCRQQTNLDFAGVVQAKPLVSILQKLPEESIELMPSDSELVIVGKRRQAGIRLDKELLLPLGNVDKTKKWLPVPEGFAEAVTLVHECAGKDESQFWATCVRVHSEWIEACDNFQLSRYKLGLDIKEPFLIRGYAIKCLGTLDLKEFSVSESWVHFRNRTGLTVSCRKYLEEYPDLTKLLKVSGSPTVLPKGLSEAAEKAEVFSAENSETNQVQIELRPGKLRIKGIGVSGWYNESKKINYKGKPMSFMISPRLLSELCKRYNECEISEDRLKVTGGNFVYIACLEKPSKENGNEQEKETSEDSDEG